jgi:hypothetical protein
MTVLIQALRMTHILPTEICTTANQAHKVSLYQNTTIIIDLEGRYSEDIKINQGVRKDCSLSPTLFNIYFDDVIREWKTRSNPGIWLKETAALNTLLFADDQIIIQESKDELQRSIFYLNNI